MDYFKLGNLILNKLIEKNLFLTVNNFQINNKYCLIYLLKSGEPKSFYLTLAIDLKIDQIHLENDIDRICECIINYFNNPIKDAILTINKKL